MFQNLGRGYIAVHALVEFAMSCGPSAPRAPPRSERFLRFKSSTPTKRSSEGPVIVTLSGLLRKSQSLEISVDNFRV